MKLTIKQLDEVAKWRKTSFKTSLTDEEVLKIEDQYGRGNIYVHFDDGVPQSTRGAGTTHKKPEKLWFEPEPEADLTKDPDERDDTLDDPRSTKRVPQKSFNPQTKFETPVGIYMYQMDYLRDDLNIDDFSSRGQISSIPFAARSNFIYFYYLKPGSILNLNDLHKTDIFDRTLRKAKEILGPDIDKTGSAAATELGNLLYLSKLEDYARPAGGKLIFNHIDSGKPYYELFKADFKGGDISPEVAFAKVWFYFSNNLMKKNINRWSKLLVDLGVRAIRDDGNGIIHPSEPHQSVVIDTSVAKLLIVKNNPNAGKKDQSQGGTAETKKYEQWASKSSDPKILKRIFNLNNQILDGHLAYNKNAPKGLLLKLLDKPYVLHGIIGSLLNNSSINLKDIKDAIIRLIDHYKTSNSLSPSRGAYVTIRDAIHYLKDDEEYLEKGMRFFGEDRYGIIDFFNVVQPDDDKLKYMLVLVKPEIRKDLISELISNGKIVASPDWIYWLWEQPLPVNELGIHVLRQLYKAAESGDGIPLNQKSAEAFLDTIYKNTMNGQPEAEVYKEDVKFIYKRFPGMDPFKFARQVAEVRMRHSVKRKTLLGRRF